MANLLQALWNLVPALPSQSDVDFLKAAHPEPWLVPVKELAPMPPRRPGVERAIDRRVGMEKDGS